MAEAHWTPPGALPDDLSLAAQLDQLVEDHPEQLVTLVAQFSTRLLTPSRQVKEVDESRAAPEIKAQFARMMDEAQR
jgi:hypothetical protein